MVPDPQARLARYAQALSSLNPSQAHEIRSQLGAVTLHLDLAREFLAREPGMEGSTSERVRTEVERGSEGLRRMHALLEGLLAQMRLGSAARERFDLRALLSDLEGTVRAVVRDRRIEWQLCLPTREAAVMGDREALREALLIALVDALQPLQSGGRLEMRLEGSGDALLVTIQGGAREAPASAECRDGLEIVRATFEDHGGALRLDGAAGLELRLPAWRATS
jgi:signal transduction histidine kinase